MMAPRPSVALRPSFCLSTREERYRQACFLRQSFCPVLLILLALLFSAIAAAQENGKLQLHLMDVGQGDHAVLISPQGETSAAMTARTTSPSPRNPASVSRLRPKARAADHA